MRTRNPDITTSVGGRSGNIFISCLARATDLKTQKVGGAATQPLKGSGFHEGKTSIIGKGRQGSMPKRAYRREEKMKLLGGLS